MKLREFLKLNDGDKAKICQEVLKGIIEIEGGDAND